VTPTGADHVTTVWPESADFVALSEARGWLGLYGDQSLDEQVRACLHAAIAKVTAFVGFNFQAAAVTEHFPGDCRHGRVLLATRPAFIRDGSLAVAFYDSRNERQAADPAEWTLDPTSEQAELLLSLRAAELSRDFRSPVEVTYDLDAQSGGPDAAALRTGVQLVTQRLWTLRGQDAAPGLSDRALSSLLQSLKIAPAVAAP